MDPFERSQRRREAQRRLWARRQRVGQLRSRVVAGSLIGFVLVWGVVFTQMATGNDPILGGGRQAAARPRESDGRRDRRRASEATAAPREAIETTDPEEAEVEEEQAQVVPSVETVEPEAEFEPEPEAEAEFFEPEPVETTQS